MIRRWQARFALCSTILSFALTRLSAPSFLYGYSYVDGGQEMRWFSRST